MVSALLLELPNTHTYKVIFMQRRMEEILASQKTMLKRTGKPTDAVSDEKMAGLFRKHLSQVEKWIGEQPNIQVLYVSYNDMLADPLKEIERINQFLGSELDTGKMASVVDRTLYRQRSTNA
jgi:hypothetical protein